MEFPKLNHHFNIVNESLTGNEEEKHAEKAASESPAARNFPLVQSEVIKEMGAAGKDLPWVSATQLPTQTIAEAERPLDKDELANSGLFRLQADGKLRTTGELPPLAHTEKRDDAPQLKTSHPPSSNGRPAENGNSTAQSSNSLNNGAQTFINPTKETMLNATKGAMLDTTKADDMARGKGAASSSNSSGSATTTSTNSPASGSSPAADSTRPAESTARPQFEAGAKSPLNNPQELATKTATLQTDQPGSSTKTAHPEKANNAGGNTGTAQSDRPNQATGAPLTTGAAAIDDVELEHDTLDIDVSALEISEDGVLTKTADFPIDSEVAATEHLEATPAAETEIETKPADKLPTTAQPELEEKKGKGTPANTPPIISSPPLEEAGETGLNEGGVVGSGVIEGSIEAGSEVTAGSEVLTETAVSEPALAHEQLATGSTIKTQTEVATETEVATDGKLAQPGVADPTKNSSALGKQLSVSDSNSSPATKLNELITTSSSKIYSIGVGQSLEQVAQDMNIDVFDLLKANPHLLRDPLLFAGQRLKVPQAASQQLPTNNEDGSAHVRSRSTSQWLGSLGSKDNPQLSKVADKTSAQLERSGGNLKGGPSSPQPLETSERHAAENLSAKGARAGETVPTDGRANPLSAKDDERAERTERRSNEKKNIKQNDELIPGYGIHGNRDFEDEEGVERQRKERGQSMPEPFDEWADIIFAAADKYNVDAALIAALIWCESAGKNIVGKDGHGYGLMQIDDRRFRNWLQTNDGLDPIANIDFGTSILRKNIDHFRGKLAAGVAAYDCGIDAVEEALVLGKSVDHFTTGGNYSLKILTQLSYFRRFFGDE